MAVNRESVLILNVLKKLMQKTVCASKNNPSLRSPVKVLQLENIWLYAQIITLTDSSYQSCQTL